MEIAFEPGYDPALNLVDHGIKSRGGAARATGGVDWVSDVRRDEQDVIDEIVHGMRHGHYILLMGPNVSHEPGTLRRDAHYFSFRLSGSGQDDYDLRCNEAD